MTENKALIKSAFLNSVTSHVVVIRHVQSQLSDSLSIWSACRSGSVHICPQTKVNFGNCSWLHQFSTCRKKRGRHPSWDACVGAPGGESLQRVAADNGCSAESRCSSLQSCFYLWPYDSQIPPLPTILLTSAAVFLLTLPFYPLMFDLRLISQGQTKATDKSYKPCCFCWLGTWRGVSL